MQSVQGFNKISRHGGPLLSETFAEIARVHPFQPCINFGDSNSQAHYAGGHGFRADLAFFCIFCGVSLVRCNVCARVQCRECLRVCSRMFSRMFARLFVHVVANVCAFDRACCRECLRVCSRGLSRMFARLFARFVANVCAFVLGWFLFNFSIFRFLRGF